MTEPGQIDYCVPTGFDESNKKIEEFRDGLSDLLKNSPDPRIIPIVWQVGFEHYVRGILMMSLDSKKSAKYLRYTEQIDVLMELGYFSENISFDLKKFYEIRNKYAHIINIDEEGIKHILDSMKSNFSPNPDQGSSSNAKRLELLCVELQKQIEPIYQKVFEDNFDIVT